MTLLKCRVKPGLVDDEVGIVVRGVDRNYECSADPIDVLLPDTVKSGPGFISVRLVDEDLDGHRALVELSTIAQCGASCVWVPDSELKW